MLIAHFPHLLHPPPAAEEYFTREVLDESDGLEELGGVQWRLLLCLLAAWVIVCLCLIRGIKSSGKVVYFTATFPYVILVILFFRAVTLPGWSAFSFSFDLPRD